LITREETLTATVFQGGDRPIPELLDPGKDGAIGVLLKKCCEKISTILIGMLILILVFIALYLRE